MTIVVILHCSNSQDNNAAMQKLHNPLQRLDYICGNESVFCLISNRFIDYGSLIHYWMSLRLRGQALCLGGERGWSHK